MRYRDFFLITEDNKLASLNNLKKKFDDAIAQEWHQKLLDIDPTKDNPNPSFIGKLTKFFLENPSNGQFNNIKEAFEKFLLLSKRHIWKRDAKPTDINQYKQFLKFAGEVHRVYGKNLDSLGIEKDKKVEKKSTDELDKIFGIHFDPKHVMYQDDDVISVRVDTPKESIRYGSKFGDWCTTWKSNNYFYRYKFDDEFDTPANMYYVYFPKRYSANNKDPKAVLHFGRDEEGNISYTDRDNRDNYQDLDWLQKQFPEELGGKDMDNVFPYQEISKNEKEIVDMDDEIPYDQFINFSDSEKMLYIQSSEDRIITLNKFNGMSRAMQEQYLGFCENNEILLDFVLLSQIYDNAMGKRYLNKMQEEYVDRNNMFEKTFLRYSMEDIHKYKNDIFKIGFIEKYMSFSGAYGEVKLKYSNAYESSYLTNLRRYLTNAIGEEKTSPSQSFKSKTDIVDHAMANISKNLTGIFSFSSHYVPAIIRNVLIRIEAKYNDEPELVKYAITKGIELAKSVDDTEGDGQYESNLRSSILSSVAEFMPNDVDFLIEYLKNINPNSETADVKWNVEQYKVAFRSSFKELKFTPSQLIDFIEKYKEISNLDYSEGLYLLFSASSNFYEIYQKLVTIHGINASELLNKFFLELSGGSTDGRFLDKYETLHDNYGTRWKRLSDRECLLDFLKFYSNTVNNTFSFTAVSRIFSLYFTTEDFTTTDDDKLYSILQKNNPISIPNTNDKLFSYIVHMPNFSFGKVIQDISSFTRNPQFSSYRNFRVIQQLPLIKYNMESESNYNIFSSLVDDAINSKDMKLLHFIKKHESKFLDIIPNKEEYIQDFKHTLSKIESPDNLTESTFKKHLSLLHNYLNSTS